MTRRRAPIGLFLGAMLAASLAAGAASDSGTQISAATAPAGTDARLKRALSEAVRLHVGEAGLESSLRGYTIAPALVQLRRYVERDEKHAKIVCVVDLSLRDQRRGFVANIRGNGATLGASPLDAVDAAASSAVSRVPAVLAGAQDSLDTDQHLAAR